MITTTEMSALRLSPSDALSTIISIKGRVSIGQVDRNSHHMSMDEIERTKGSNRAELMLSLQRQLQQIKGLEDAVVVDEESQI